MTRDEAVQLVCNRWVGVQDAFGLVEALSALGVLKLERPGPTLDDKIEGAIFYAGTQWGKPTGSKQLKEALHLAGLKIVEA